MWLPKSNYCMVMYYRFIYWSVACRTIIFVFLIAWDPYALSFLGLYQVPEANPCIPHCLLKKNNVVKEPCIGHFWNTIPLCLNLTSEQWQYSLHCWVQLLPVHSSGSGPAASSSSHFRSTVWKCPCRRIAEPVWVVLSSTPHLQHPHISTSKPEVYLIYWKFLEEIEHLEANSVASRLDI